MFAAVALVGILIPAVGVDARVPRCAGLRATIVGTNRADILLGTARRDVIVGLGGGDTISGRGGDDVVCSGSGKDRIIGGGHPRLPRWQVTRSCTGKGETTNSSVVAASTPW